MIVTNFHGFVGYFTTIFTTEEEIRATLPPLAQSAIPSDNGPVPNGTAAEDNVSGSVLSDASRLLLQRLLRRDPKVNLLHTLSTSPECAGTHWQQALFFTADQLLMLQDQELVGEIVVGQCNDNKRYLDIQLHWTIMPHENPSQWLPNPAIVHPHKRLPAQSARGIQRYQPSAQARPWVNPYATHTQGHMVTHSGSAPGAANCPAYAGAANPPAYPDPGANFVLQEPDTQNQIEEPNPPMTTLYAHSKVFGFK